MNESTQALCFLAGANSIFSGDKLLTAANAGDSADAAMFAKLGLKPLQAEEPMRSDPPRNGEGDHAEPGGGGGVQSSEPPPSALAGSHLPVPGRLD
jgi:hypothetical protein